MKYASRQELYSEPNVFDSVVVAARDILVSADFARGLDLLFVTDLRAGPTCEVALRAVDFWVALRDIDDREEEFLTDLEFAAVLDT